MYECKVKASLEYWGLKIKLQVRIRNTPLTFLHQDLETVKIYVSYAIAKNVIYSRDHKFVVFCFVLLLQQILDKFQNQCQFWKLLVLTISKHPLHVQFDQVLAEIFEVKDKWLESFISMVIDLLEMKITEIWTICSKS